MFDQRLMSLRYDFREFCVINLVLRQIDNCFSSAGIKKGQVSNAQIISGQRRMLVEEYYSGINWSDEKDVSKFLDAIELLLKQWYLNQDARQELTRILQNAGYSVKETNVLRLNRITTDRKFLIPSDLAQKWANLLIEEEKPQKRGFSFESLIGEVFELFELAPRRAFRLQGEQIDGSFQFESETYLIEAKWHNHPTPQSDLLIFKGKVEGKSTWTRGLFISYGGFSDDGIAAFRKGRSTNIIGMTGEDFYYILSGKITLPEAISKKVRYTAETGEFFFSIADLLNE